MALLPYGLTLPGGASTGMPYGGMLSEAPMWAQLLGDAGAGLLRYASQPGAGWIQGLAGAAEGLQTGGQRRQLMQRQAWQDDMTQKQFDLQEREANARLQDAADKKARNDAWAKRFAEMNAPSVTPVQGAQQGFGSAGVVTGPSQLQQDGVNIPSSMLSMVNDPEQGPSLLFSAYGQAENRKAAEAERKINEEWRRLEFEANQKNRAAQLSLAQQDNDLARLRYEHEVANPNEPTVEVFDPETGLTTYMTRSQAIGKQAPPPSGFNMEFGPDGKPISISQGRPGAKGTNGLSTTVVSDQQKSALAAADHLSQIDQVISKFKPEYQTLAGRGQAWWTAIKEKTGIGDVPEADREALAGFTAYKQDTARLFLGIAHDLVGSAITQNEAPRIEATLPVAGTGIFDGDSPTEFEAKARNFRKQVGLALARKAYTLQNGMKFDAITLDQMEQKINERGDQLKAQGIPDAEIANRLRAEFGLQGAR